MNHALQLMGFVVVTFCAPAMGAFAKPGPWYQTIERPTWNPPSWIFGPVWTLLYISMAVAAWLVWRRQGWGRPMVLYGTQLVLNAAWTPVFFGAHQIGGALVVILLLWFSVLLTMGAFMRVHKIAGMLLVPYFAWLSFATFLNYTLWRLNG